jgi:O-antigen biosynthesis protein
VRVTLVMSVYNQLDLTRACLESLRASREPFRLVVIDNGSTDGTAEFFARFPYPYPLRFARNETNQSVLATYNRAWRLADTEFICLLHNDTEMLEPTWLVRLLAPFSATDTGMTGLYGVKRVRRDGTYVGRTIVHSLAEGPTVRAPSEEVAVVDAVCMLLPRALMEAVGGLDEGYGFYHCHDKDLSLAVRERGRRCYVVHAPFHHRGGGTRTREFAERRDVERRDLGDRRAANARFAAKFRHRLPLDVRPTGQRLREWISAKVTAGGPPGRGG